MHPPAQRILTCINPTSMSSISESYTSWQRKKASLWSHWLTRLLRGQSRTSLSPRPMRSGSPSFPPPPHRFLMVYQVRSWVSLQMEAPTPDAAKRRVRALLDQGHLQIRNYAIEREDVYVIPE